MSLIIFFISIFQSNSQEIIKPLQKQELTEEYFGKKVSDPYRYLEKNLDNNFIVDWIKENNEVTSNYFKNIESTDKVLEKILNSYDKKGDQISSTRITSNNKYFYLKTKSENNFSELFYKNGKDGKEVLIFDPSSYRIDDGVKYKINHISPCLDGEKIAIGVTENDTEFSDIIVIDVESKEIIFKTNKKSWPSALGGIKWNANCDGIYYTHVPVTDKNKEDYLFNTEAIYFNIENKQEKTVLFSKENNPDVSFKEEDFPLLYFDFVENKHIVGTVAGVAKYRNAYISSLESISKKKNDWRPLFKVSDKVRRFFLFKDELIFLTAKNASNFKICRTLINNPNFEKPEVLVPEYTNEIITDFAITKDGIYFVKVKNGVEANLMLLKNNGNLKSIELPIGAGNIKLQTKSPIESDLWVTLQGWTINSKKYFYDVISNSFILENSKSNSEKNNKDDIVVEEILVQSHDKKDIPLSIIYKRGFKKNGNHPLFITAYGAYGRSINPRSTALISNWIDEGGVYAVAHVRGGGEKGYEWYTEGLKLNKANSWKDLISCVKYLQEYKYTKSSKTVAWGASAGGIAVGKAVLEEPSLFSAAVITSGMLNTLRSEFAPNGKNNAKEFGTVKNPKEFESLLAMDSYQSLQKNTSYPSFLVTTGLNDSRVASWQSMKFVARLREYSSSKKPILFSVDFESGHGYESSKRKMNIKIGEIIVFALSQTGHPEYQPNE
ncbi:prolyl oligopeptidase family serine peptidase [Aquimarina algicola]|uniref:prolyl oligopeptidase family serine peptidase n=1 Tax=Aquimarina algicola TaxID=2589995 RepID=UPI001CF1210E|nr:prolyl oligopeptidase family serine peptidase [Aquimarina algicola]